MPGTRLRVAVVGAGAIGGLLAARLAALPEVELSLLARGETLAALQGQGLTLSDADGSQNRPVRASADPQELGPQDLVIVAVKSPALAAVAPAVRALLTPESQVLVAMNGIPWWFFHGLGGPLDGQPLESADPGQRIAAAIPAGQVVGCVVHLSSTVQAPGHIRHVGGNGLIIGEPAGPVSPRVQALHGLLSRAGFAASVSERIQQDIWFKLWGNMTMNPISALTGASCDRILDDPLVRAFASSVMQEAQAIGQQIGCPIDQSPDDRHAVTRKLGAFKTSMLQDVEAGKAIELDALLGTVREIGQRLALPTPQIDALLGLTRLMARTRQLYPSPETPQ